jgi:hypothetical protein
MKMENQNLLPMVLGCVAIAESQRSYEMSAIAAAQRHREPADLMQS